MVMKIERDQSRFKQIVRGKIRENLRKYITHGEMIGRKGRDLVSIPVAAARRAAVPLRQERLAAASARARRRRHSRSAAAIRRRRRHRARPAAIRARTSSRSSHARRAGRRSSARAGTAAHRAQGQGQHHQEKDKYTSIRQTGPESLRHFKRTYKKALQRQISTEHLRPGRPAGHADPRGQALPLLEHDPAAASQRRHHLHDGRLRLDDRRAEGDRPHRGVLDRHLAQEPVRRHRDALHHPRRRGQGGRRSTRSTTPAKAAARGSARPTRCATS